MSWHGLFYTEFNIFAAIIVVMILVTSIASWGHSTKERIFREALGFLLLFLLADTLWNMVDRTAFLSAHRWVMYVLKTIYFYSADCMAFSLYQYFKQDREDEDMEKIRIRILHTLPPLLLHSVLIIVNFPTGILFYLSEGGVYMRGPVFSLQYIIIFSYLVSASVFLLRLAAEKDMETDRRQLLINAAFPLIPLASGILQYFYPKMPVNNVGFTCYALYLFLTYVQQQVSVEPLTGLSNRRYFLKYMDQLTKNRKEGSATWLFMTDINDFKQINDRFGHPEGDRALKFVAEGIVRACAQTDCRYMAARYGGDEFIFALTVEEDFDTTAFTDSVRKYIDDAADRHRFPGNLTISIGYSLLGPDIVASVKAADEALYENKRSYHRTKKAV